MKDINSLEHTKWRCQYHVVFAPKYRRQVIYREIRADIGFILRKLCEQKGVEIYRGKRMSRSYSYVDQYSTEIQRIADHGIFEREE